jgi:pyruvate formate lyase activating enzyme
MRWIGERRTAGDLMEEVWRDVPFYEDGGGMTLTGGEPTMQPDLCEALLRLARADCISTGMETCGHTRWAVLERLLPYLDDILFDLKHVDSAVHLAFTGLGNELILSNLRHLAALGAPVTVRVPLIPGFNASPESVRAIAEFVLGLCGSVKGIDLLPYHTLGKAKYTALGREYPWEGHNRLTGAQVETLAGIVQSYGLAVQVGG